MAAKPLIDAEQRAQALDVQHSFIVQAPAGSGKTTLLTQRFLRLLASTDVPESIIAITFSRKAAEEMRARVVGALTAVSTADHGLDAVTAQWAEAALARAERLQWDLDTNPRRLRILTIDALAQLIVRRHPLLAGGTGGQQVIEDAAGLYVQAARNTIEEVATGSEWSPAVRRIATHVDNNWARLEGLLSKMLAMRDQWLRPVVSDPQRESIEQVLTEIVATALTPLSAAVREIANGGELLEICQFCGANVASVDPDAAIANLRELSALPIDNADDLPQWRAIAQLFLTDKGLPRQRLTKNQGFPASDKHAKALKARLTEIISACDGQFLDALYAAAALPDPHFDDDTWENLAALFTVLKLAVAHLGLVFQQSGQVDFTEITLSALNALGSEDAPSDASLLLDYQIDHLLIDEFQDTSVVQYQLIEKLIAGWSGEQQRTLFLVGDPKQSIYRFRQADVSRFSETFSTERFAQVPIKALHLRANFRSDPLLIDWINQAETKMAAADPLFPQSPSLSAVKPAHSSARVDIHQLTPNDSSGRHVVELVRQAQHVARRSGDTLSIAVLVRNRSHLRDITRQLRAADIALLASDIDKLLDQPVVSDLWALTRALLHPADTTAWLAILRAPWLGLSLTELSHISLTTGDALVAGALTNIDGLRRLDADTIQRVCQFKEVIQPALAMIGRRAVTEVVADTWHALGGSEMAAHDNAYHYVEQYFRLLNEFESREGVIAAPAFEQFLNTRYVSPQATGGDAVQVMTIHKAKGLEFDMVILPGLNQGTRSDDKPLLRWQATAKNDLLMSLLPGTGREDRLYEYLHGQEKQAGDAESYRLLYVALTRAKRELHLLCEVDEDASEPRKGSLQRLLWPALVDVVSVAAIDAQHDTEPAQTAEPKTKVLLRLMRNAIHAGRMPVTEFSAPDPRADLEFLWASSSAKYIGTVTHDILHFLGEIGWQRFSELWHTSSRQLIAQRLTAIGIERDKLAPASDKVAQAVDTLLQSPRGRWLFDPAHRRARSELPLSAVVDGEVINVILDRTFIDVDGVRWIVDFKTSEHLEADLSGFLDIQVERYQPQLSRYAEVMSLLEPGEIKLALYFPIHDAWREWRHVSEQTPR